MTEDYELLREMKRKGEEIIFSVEKGRMMLISEIWDNSTSSLMEQLSREYGVDSREKFIQFKEKYNITDY
jgi:hypothetical protein